MENTPEWNSIDDITEEERQALESAEDAETAGTGANTGAVSVRRIVDTVVDGG